MSNKSKKSLAQLLRKWVARGSRVSAPRPTAKLRVEQYEERVVPATTPPVSFTTYPTVPVVSVTDGDGAYAPQVVADPTNPNTLALIAAEPTGIQAQISFDGGTTWTEFRNTTDPFRNNTTSGGKLRDPDLPLDQSNNWYTNVSSPTIAFTRSGKIYVSYLEHNALKTSGSLVVERFTVDRAAQATTQDDLETAVSTGTNPQTYNLRSNGSDNQAAVLYRWQDNGGTVNRPANIYLAVDTNLPTVTDPVTGLTSTNPFTNDPTNGAINTETVFVAWNMVSSTPTVQDGGSQNLGYTPNAVMLAIGRDDPLAAAAGLEPFQFTTPLPVNDAIFLGDGGASVPAGGHFLGAGNTQAQDNTGGIAPQIVFTPPRVVSGYDTDPTTPGSQQIVTTPGQMSIVWSTVGNRFITSTVDLDGSLASAAYEFRSTNNPTATSFSSPPVGVTPNFYDGTPLIRDAIRPASGPDIAVTTSYQLTVDLTQFAGTFTSLDDLDVGLGISSPNLAHLQIVLRAPDGTAITLVDNRINTSGGTNIFGTGVPRGMTGVDMGVFRGVQGSASQQNGTARLGGVTGTDFSQEAARQIHDPVNNGSGYGGSYRPQGGTLSTLYGLNAAALSGTWTLEITDARSDGLTATFGNVTIPDAPIQMLRYWSLDFVSAADNRNLASDSKGYDGRYGADTFARIGGIADIATLVPPKAGINDVAGDQVYPTNAGPAGTAAGSAAGVFGVGSGLSVAYDSSFGSYSRFGGRLYAVFTGGGGTNTNIFLTSSDDNGASWTAPVQVNDDRASDSFTEGVRTQYQPTVTVDPTNGMVVVMWFDARNDASNSRVQTYIATSIDGGETFSLNQSVNEEKTAIDAVTGRTVVLEQVPTNVNGQPVYGTGLFQYGGVGIRQSLLAYGGVIQPFWSGNRNTNALGESGIFTAKVLSAAGPRVVDSDMGAVSGISVDLTASGGQLQVGAIRVRDENNSTTPPLSAAPYTIPELGTNAPRTQYNDRFGADGTRLIDGFRVVFDRPVYFTGLGVADPEAFDPTDIEVRYRSPFGGIPTTQGALIPIARIVPIGGYTLADGSFFATAYFVQFQTPQSAVGTYSYAVKPTLTERVRSQVGASFAAADTPLTIPDTINSPAVSQIVVPQLAGSPTTDRVRLTLGFDHPRPTDLLGELITPTGQVIALNPIVDPLFGILSNGVFTLPLTAVATGTPLTGQWTLRLTDTQSGPVSATVPMLVHFQLDFVDAAGEVAQVVRLGNWMDQDADGTQRERGPAGAGNNLGAENDTYTAPGTVNDVPFAGPYDSTTRPLIQPGAHVTDVYPGGQFATAVTVTRDSASQLTVTLDREIDPDTLTVAGLTVLGPTGSVPLTGATITPTNVVNFGTRTFTITLTNAFAAAGQYSVLLGNSVYVADNTVLNGTVNDVYVRFDRDIDPASFRPGNVLRMTGPTGAVPLAVVSVTPVAEDRSALPAGTVAARLFRVTFDQPQLVFAQAAPVAALTVTLTLSSAPSVGPLALADLLVTGPKGKVDLTGATLTRTATSPQHVYTLTVPAATAGAYASAAYPAGQYTVNITPTPNRVTRTVTTQTQQLSFTLDQPPLSGQPLTIGSIFRVSRPDGAMSLSGVTLQANSLTSYTLTFPNPLDQDTYTIELTPAALRGAAVAGTGVRVSGPYMIEFGNLPTAANPDTAPIRAADRPQLVTELAAATTTLTVTLSAGALTGPANVVRVYGPTATIPAVIGVTPIGGSTYQLTFAGLLQPGQYVVDFTAGVRVASSPGRVWAVDNNLNAGLDLLTGRTVAGGSLQPVSYQTQGQAPAVPISAATAAGPSVSELPLVISDDFTIQQNLLNQIRLGMNISFPDVTQLRVELMPPTGSPVPSVLLFSGADRVAQGGGAGANFTNTLLTDRIGLPSVLLAAAPFTPTTGSGFTPQNPLGVLADPTTPTGALGTWRLRVTNFSTAQAGQITNWSLVLPRAVPASGLGEQTADRFQAGFRVLTTDPTNDLTRDAWTPVGPASANEGANAGRANAVVADPSDPSGNTVYVGGASGGVWKTTNFLTSDIDGPQWVPLTDFGVTSGVNIQSMALFPRNGDPNQTIVFALTGDGNSRNLSDITEATDRGRAAAGVGLLRSTDGGRTWVLLDSTNNRSSDLTLPPGSVGNFSDSNRNHLFAGASGFKLVVDPTLSPTGGVIVYMAVQGNAQQAGVWRSLDGGLTWTRIQQGQATDVALASGSGVVTGSVTAPAVGNLQRLYAAFGPGNPGDVAAGVYTTNSAPTAGSLTLMAGNGAGQLPDLRNVTGGTGGTPVTVQNNPAPTNIGRVVIATPALTGSTFQNFNYRDWTYALVVTPNGSLGGLYVTKDAGLNWTRVVMPIRGVFGTNNENQLDYDLFASPYNSEPAPNFTQSSNGFYDVSLAVDPQNPNVLYLGGVGIGTGGRLLPNGTKALPNFVGDGSIVGGTIRIDLTGIKDTQALINNNNSDPNGGTFGNSNFQSAANGGIVTTGLDSGKIVPGNDPSGTPLDSDYLNVRRDPNNPFTTSSTLLVSQINALVNNGTDARWRPFTEILAVGTVRDPGTTLTERNGLSNIHAIFPFVDPVSGQTRLIYAGDQGVFTGVDRGDGLLTYRLGFDRQVAGTRNGNLQLTQVVSGAVQPSQLAADVAGALFYAMAQDNGFLVSDPRILENGNTNWRGPAGDGAWVEVDPTGSGLSIQYRSPLNFGLDLYSRSNPLRGLPQEFLRLFNPQLVATTGEPAFGGGSPSTFGLIQAGDFPPAGTVGINGGQWLPGSAAGNVPFGYGVPFAINPVNPQGLVIMSTDGRVFRSTDGGASWNFSTIVVNGINTGGSVLDATGPGALAFGADDPNNPAQANTFIYIGSAGTGQAGGVVYFSLDGGSNWTTTAALDGSPIRRIVPNPAPGSREVYVVTNEGVYYKQDVTVPGAWTDITGNLFGLTRAVFGNSTDQAFILPDPNGPLGLTRVLNTLAVDWRYADPTVDPQAPPQLYVGGVGGVFKSEDNGTTWRLYPEISQDGAVAEGGNLPMVEVTDLDLSIGNLNPVNGRYESGGLNLLLASTYGRGSWAIRLNNDVPTRLADVGGPAVSFIINPTPNGPTSNQLVVQFNGPVLETTALDVNNYQLLPVDALGAPTGSAIPIQSVAPVPGVPDRYTVTFQNVSIPNTLFRFTVGYNSPSSGVPTITGLDGVPMNQDADATSGEAFVDQFVTVLTLNAPAGVNQTLYVSPISQQVVAGTAGSVSVEVRDPSTGGVITGLNGTLTVTWVGPGPVTLTQNGSPVSGNTVNVVNGVASFTVSATTAGPYSFTVSSGTNVTAGQTSFSVAVIAGTASQVTLSPAVTPNAAAGTGVALTIGFEDQFGNATTFAGAVSILYQGNVGPGSPGAVVVDPQVPSSATFTVFPTQTGQLVVTADAGVTTTPGQATINVVPGAVASLMVSVSPSPATAGLPATVTLQAFDANGNAATNANGPVTLTGIPAGSVVSPNPPALVNGVASFQLTIPTSGTYSLAAQFGAVSQPFNLVVGPAPLPPTPTDQLTGVFAAATGVDGTPFVQVYQANGSLLTTLLPFPPGYASEVDAGSPGFTGGIRVSVADVTGDGIADYVVGSGPTITATVQVIDGATNRTILTLRPFADFKGGVFVSTGDLTGDGIADIVITPDQGGGPRVTIIAGKTFTQVANFFGIDDANFRGGARAAMGDVNGDGFAELVVSAGFGGGPRISIYDGAALAQGTRLNVIGDFFLFEEALRNGAYVAVGDVNGDGFADLIGGAGPGGGPRVLILDSVTMLQRGPEAALSAPLFNGFLGDINNRGGVRVAAKNLNNDRLTDLLIGAGEGGGSRAEAYSGDGFGLLQSIDLLPGYTGGVFVG
ncbi:FG-GAP-like repeat-containing protein [Urbifossiella limnaea]|uniref:Proprotein convertase P-domain protein n=1 Tax=Urbifossiella limnaea TaxID=2528023 RepID=A0A517XP68_9BACT|nr:FG-GAP-like repeat-containing protein [Urbifossiella limnaea]QDU19299.1 Proprotein convertase P-domain protein [Urbifossiella limnaea]